MYEEDAAADGSSVEPAARVVDLDHVVAYDHEAPGRGGRTTPANLAALGRREHVAKTARLVDVEGDANGVLSYRTRTGHRYPSPPHRYLDPKGPDPPGRAATW